MEIYTELPEDLQRKIQLLTLEHPCATLIKREIERLNCDRVYKFKFDGKVVCQVNGVDFFATEYFTKLNGHDDDDSNFAEELFNMLFDVSDTSSDEKD
jgi:hypothetical protein